MLLNIHNTQFITTVTRNVPKVNNNKYCNPNYKQYRLKTSIKTTSNSNSNSVVKTIKNVSPPLQGKHFIHIDDFSSDEIKEMLSLGKKAKEIYYSKDNTFKPFKDKSMAMIFTKPSSRTRISFETGFTRFGGHAIYLDPTSIQFGKRELTKDIARVLSSYNDVIMARLFEHDDILELAEYSKSPVINGLTNFNHPCQIMADALTIIEHFGTIENKKIVYVGASNNISNSWIKLASRLPFDFTISCPKGYEPDDNLVRMARETNVSSISIINDLHEAVKGADVVYTDVWISMGEEAETEERLKAFMNYQVNERVMKEAGKNAVFMHCLPATRGRECVDEVTEAPYSLIFEQAENRMHAQNGILCYVLSERERERSVKGISIEYT